MYRVYLADDHVLEVCEGSFNESYRRFILQDIRSFTIERTATYMWFNSILAAWGTLLWAILVLSGVGFALSILFSWLLPALLLTVNLLRGPTCRCRIATGVQTTVLGALRREKTARRAREEIAEYAAGCQGGRLGPGEIEQRVVSPPATEPRLEHETPSSGERGA